MHWELGNDVFPIRRRSLPVWSEVAASRHVDDGTIRALTHMCSRVRARRRRAHERTHAGMSIQRGCIFYPPAITQKLLPSLSPGFWPHHSFHCQQINPMKGKRRWEERANEKRTLPILGTTHKRRENGHCFYIGCTACRTRWQLTISDDSGVLSSYIRKCIVWTVITVQRVSQAPDAPPNIGTTH